MKTHYTAKSEAEAVEAVEAVIMVLPYKDADAAPARFYTVDELITETRFFWSGGRPYDDFEKRLFAAVEAMRVTVDKLNFSQVVSFIFSGLEFSVMNARRAEYKKQYE